ncbi:MAG: hypothetical protein ACFFCM_16935, partial [Promethearchaeota archaeon]
EKAQINFKLSISNFEMAYQIAIELNNKQYEHSSLGFINLLKYISASEKDSKLKFLESAKICFNKARKLDLKDEDLIKMAILENRTLVLLIGENIIRIGEIQLLEELTSKFEESIAYIWEKVEKHQDFPEIYIYKFLKSIREISGWIIALYPSGQLKIDDFLISTIKKYKNFINFLENTQNVLSLFYAYSIFAFLNLLYSKYYAKNQFEEKLYLKRSQKWIKKAEACIIQANHALSLYYYCSLTISLCLTSLGYFSKDFKSTLVDLDNLIVSGSLSFPKITIAQVILDTAGSLLDIGLSTSRSITEDLRTIFANKALELIELPTTQLSLLKDLKYRLFNLIQKYNLCAAYGILADLLKDQNYLETARTIYKDIPDFIHPKFSSTNTYYNEYLYSISRTGLILAKISSKEEDKVAYYQITLDLLENIPKEHQTLENMFLVGDIYFELGKLKNEEKIFKKSTNSYVEAIEFCEHKGFYNLIGSAYNNLAQIEDRLGNYLFATENYEKSIEFFEKAMLTISSSHFGDKIENLRNYLKAWRIIEEAKSNHIKEIHKEAQKKYEMASQILDKINEYKFEAPFYCAWAKLEDAEFLSKNGEHNKSADAYLNAEKKFEKAMKILNSHLQKQKPPEIKARISKLIQVARVRDAYCTARRQIENARIESKKGNNLVAAELYGKAGEIFETLCQSFKIQKEKNELTGIYHLCHAWKNMEKAYVEQNPSVYAKAAELFRKAGEIFPESRMKKLSIGNAQYCTALQYGSLFDGSNLEEKIDFYRKIKIFLRDSARNYQLGGFKLDAQWALATSTFFDALWYLIKADNEIELSKKNKHLNVAIHYLESAKDMFDKAGYEQRKKDVLDYLSMINKEKATLISALKIIERPDITASSIGISAPSCPVEISHSLDIKDMAKADLTTESELNWFKRIHHIYFYLRDGACIYNHSFKMDKEVSPTLVAGGLTGVESLIQHVTRTDTNIKIIEQEDMDILFEHGKYVSAALITEENLITLRNKLRQSVEKIEEFYHKQLARYRGKISEFSKIGEIALEIFNI